MGALVLRPGSGCRRGSGAPRSPGGSRPGEKCGAYEALLARASWAPPYTALAGTGRRSATWSRRPGLDRWCGGAPELGVPGDGPLSTGASRGGPPLARQDPSLRAEQCVGILLGGRRDRHPPPRGRGPDPWKSCDPALSRFLTRLSKQSGTVQRGFRRTLLAISGAPPLRLQRVSDESAAAAGLAWIARPAATTER